MTSESRPRRHGWPGIATTFVSLTVLAVHHFWWVRVRMMTDFDPGWGPTDRDLTGATESITATTTTVTVAATVLTVAAPVLAWVWRRSPVWPPLVVAVLAVVATWALNDDAVAMFWNPGL